MELDPHSAGALETADGTTKRNVETLAAVRGPTAGRQAAPDRAAVPDLAGRDRGRRAGRGGRGRAQRAGPRRGRDAASAADRRAASGSRPGWCCARSAMSARRYPGVPFDGNRQTVLNENGRVIDPGTRVPIPGVYAAGWIKRGPVRGDRHQQEVRSGDAPTCCSPTSRRGCSPNRQASCEALLDRAPCHGCNVVDYTRLGGDRRPRTRARRAPRPPAREARPPRRDAGPGRVNL